MTIAPLRALLIEYKVIKEIIIFTVFRPPTRIKNPLLVNFLEICVPIIAASDGPNPGIIDAKDPTPTEVMMAENASFFGIFNLDIICEGILVFF